MSRFGAHCGRAGCPCLHDQGPDGCYAGIVDVTLPDGGDAAKPCRLCRPEQAAIVEGAPDAAEAGRRLRARSVGDPWYA